MTVPAPLALDVTHLRFAYPKGDDHAGAPFALYVDELDLAPGEQVLLAAPSGGGKSTLLNLIAGLIEPSEGTVRINGQTMHELRGASRDVFRGRSLGMIFQTFHLLAGFSAAQNVMLALHFAGVPAREHKERAGAMLTRLGIERHAAPVEKLSVGQQQRVAVARALVTNPAVVLADEPTASLDPANAMHAMELIQSVCAERNAALLCVSHDPSMAARFTKRVTLEELARGTVDAGMGGTVGEGRRA